MFSDGWLGSKMREEPRVLNVRENESMVVGFAMNAGGGASIAGYRKSSHVVIMCVCHSPHVQTAPSLGYSFLLCPLSIHEVC